jgi:hypothetical protein
MINVIQLLIIHILISIDRSANVRSDHERGHRLKESKVGCEKAHELLRTSVQDVPFSELNLKIETDLSSRSVSINAESVNRDCYVGFRQLTS